MGMFDFLDKIGLKTVLEAVKGKIPTVSNPNLLINPDFKINQRGKSSYSGDNEYTVDRWRSFGATVNPTSSGITVSKRNDADYFGFMQLIEYPTDIVGEQVTLSVKINGKVMSGTATVKMNEEQLLFALGDIGDRFVCSYSSNFGVIFVQLYGTTTYTINWVKLEIGATATPFISPAPATEILKCKRYYKTLDRGTLAFAVNDTSVAFVAPFDIPMRINPTAKILSSVVLHYCNGWLDNPDVSNMAIIATNITAKGVCYIHVGGFNVTLNGTAFAANYSFRAVTDNFIGIDAEIY